ncbi:MAG: pentapeptide repeat-containing protein [Spirulinaceae cyanobacterium SM2_1_0]|nr:pentapeptide repeat-containing protein [Spirulinaceae cyanobacterium SM2_1_0]
MQSPTFLPLDARDHYPACLRLAWLAVPVATETLDLYLTWHFGSQWESLLAGRVQFALRSGCLQIQGDASADWQPSLPPEFSLDSGALVQITVNSSPVAALWGCDFRLVSGEPVLAGASDRLHLGQWQGDETLTAQVVVAPTDLAIVNAEGLWPHQITPNQHAVLERCLAQFLVREHLTPALSWMQRRERAHRAADFAASSASLSQLKNHLAAVISQPTADLLTLAIAAGLTPATDLAGGNLRGADLRGLDLSGFDLSRTNLRGTDFSDADLSEANLQGARLGGADLSGALLSHADLRDCDLHRASLALANLGGADLTGANLLAANLSNANWSGAKVAGAQFDHGPGLTPDLQAMLVAGGARWVASEQSE